MCCKPDSVERKGLQEIAKLLIDKGAKVDTADSFGDTPLHRVESLEGARLLVQKGANVNAANKKGLTPLHFATFSETRIDLVRLLIANGAAANARNSFGHSPLDFLVADWNRQSYDMALFLVAHGAVINQSLVKHYGLVKEFRKIKKQAKVMRLEHRISVTEGAMNCTRSNQFKHLQEESS